MSVCIRKLAVMLLVLVLPWQALAAVATPAAPHHHDATAAAASAATAHDADTHHAGHQHHEHTGATLAQDQGSGSTDTAHGTCTDVCCSPALISDGALSVATAIDHGSIIPSATHRLPSRAPDSLERPPRNSLV
jgi:hypothetical protein